MAFRQRKPAVPKAPETQPYFREWCEMTGWHGVLDFYLSKNLFLKLTWLVIIVFGVFLATNQCASLIIDFTAEDQWVTRVSYEKPDNGTLDWPNIKVTNLNSDLYLQQFRDSDGIHDPYLLSFMAGGNEAALLFHDQYQAPEPRVFNQTDLENLKREMAQKMKQTLGNSSVIDVRA